MAALFLVGGYGQEGGATPPDEKLEPAISDNTGTGYLMAPSLSPGHFLRPSSLFVTPITGAPGTSRLDFDFHWGNVWNYDPDEYIIDGEWIRSAIRYSYAVKDDISLGVAVPVVGLSGGFADSDIESFHKITQMENGTRGQATKDQARFLITSDGTTNTLTEGGGWGLGDVSIFAVSRLTEGTFLLPAVTIQGEVSLPTGDADELQGTGAPGIGVSTAASKRLGLSPVIAFLGIGFQYCDVDDLATIKMRDEQVSGLVGLQYECSKTWTLIGQYLVSSPMADNCDQLAQPTYEVSIGFKGRISHDSTVELSVVENVCRFKNSADIGVHFAFGRRL